MKSHNRPFTRIKVELLEQALSQAEDPKDAHSVADALCFVLVDRYGNGGKLEVQLARLGIITNQDAYNIADEYIRRKKLKEGAIRRGTSTAV